MQKYQPVFKHVTNQSSGPAFIKCIASSAQNIPFLVDSIKNCRVDQMKIRFNLWSMVLGVYTMDSGIQQKIQQLNTSRQQYKKKKSEALSGISQQKKQAKIPKNPLMAMMKNSKAQKTNNDELLREDIRKDVERTYQDMEFFQNQNILKLLTVVLLVWCKRNPAVSYQQGMNQVLASIVYVYFKSVYTQGREPQEFGLLEQRQKQLYILFNSIEHIEADIYNVFEKIMNIQKQMYKTETDSTLKGVINPNSKNNTPILQRIITLIDHKLKFLDIQLFRALKLQDVQTKSFLLRWIRCMHTREFSLESSFSIWDSIFLDYYECSISKNSFEFIDSMCLAMFIYMRSLALTRETAYQIQQIYQKYPSLKKGGYLQQLISLAWSLCDALKNTTAQSSSDWYAQQSTRVNNKLNFLKGRQSQPKPQSLPESTKPQPPKDIAEPPLKKQEEPSEQSAQQKPSSTQQKKQQCLKQQPKQNFPITLTHEEWSALHDHLSTSIHLTTQQQVREHLQSAIHLLQGKIRKEC